jgi:hypothetical protein
VIAVARAAIVPAMSRPHDPKTAIVYEAPELVFDHQLREVLFHRRPSASQAAVQGAA